jgi:hypothetical protein
VFKCPNDQVNAHDGSTLLDPDEDDVGTLDFKPGTGFEPKWYYWETEGKVLNNPISHTCDDGNYDKFILTFRNEPKRHFTQLISDKLVLCGNAQKQVNLGKFDELDVGDYLYLTVGDQMLFLNSPGPAKLSDKFTFRPVQCNPATNPKCCIGGYWAYGEPCEEDIPNSCSECVEDRDRPEITKDSNNNDVTNYPFTKCKDNFRQKKKCDDKGNCIGPTP